MAYPGQRIQVDVKFVPAACLKNSRGIGKQFFQYTAIDEYSRWRFVEAFEEHSTYSSAQFVDHFVKAFPFPIECIQTDNGKVERSHRKDNERFYTTHLFYSFEDFAAQLKVYNRRDYNNFPMRTLGWKTPNEVLRDFLRSV